MPYKRVMDLPHSQNLLFDGVGEDLPHGQSLLCDVGDLVHGQNLLSDGVDGYNHHNHFQNHVLSRDGAGEVDARLGCLEDV